MAGPVTLVDKADAPIGTSGNPLVVSSTFTPSGTQDVNLTKVAGATVSQGHGTAATALRVELPTDGTGVIATVGAVTAVTAITNALPAGTNVIGAVTGGTASGSSLTANPVTTGGLAETTVPTAVADGQVVNSQHDIYGRQVVIGGLRSNKGIQQTTITSSTAETTVVTADATYKLDVYGFVFANKSASATLVTVKDATSGTTRGIFYVPAGDTRGMMLPLDAAWPQAAANNNWTVTCGTSIDSLYVTALYVKNL